MGLILNCMGYRLRKVVKAKPKKVPETDAIFDNIKAKYTLHERHDVKRLSMDCKATVNLGEFARGGKTRGSNQALDPDFGSLRDLEQQETRLIQ